MSDTAIRSALRRSLHFDGLTQEESTIKRDDNIDFIVTNIGILGDNSYYKFFIYNTQAFLEVEIMGGKILSARFYSNENDEIILLLSDENFFSINSKIFSPDKLDVEYSFGIFTRSTTAIGTNNDLEKRVKSKESKYYGTLVSDASKFVSTLEVKDLNLGAELQVKNIKLGKWIIENTGDNTVNIIYKDDDTVTYGG